MIKIDFLILISKHYLLKKVDHQVQNLDCKNKTVFKDTQKIKMADYLWIVVFLCRELGTRQGFLDPLVLSRLAIRICTAALNCLIWNLNDKQIVLLTKNIWSFLISLHKLMSQNIWWKKLGVLSIIRLSDCWIMQDKNYRWALMLKSDTKFPVLKS